MAEPELIDGMWWTRQPDGSWLQFNPDSQAWEAAGPPPGHSGAAAPAAAHAATPVVETPTVVLPAAAAFPSPAPAPVATSPGRPKFSFSGAPIIVWVIVGVAVLMLVGSVGPWAKVFIFTVNGTDGDGDITLVLAIIAGVMAVARASGRGIWSLIVAAVCFGLGAITGIIDWADIESTVGDEDFEDAVEVQWGLVVMTLSALAGAVLSVIAIFLPRRKRVPVAATA